MGNAIRSVFRNDGARTAHANVDARLLEQAVKGRDRQVPVDGPLFVPRPDKHQLLSFLASLERFDDSMVQLA